MIIKLLNVCVNLPCSLTYHNLHGRVQYNSFATGHAGTLRPSKKTNLYMYGAPFSIKKRQHTVLKVTLVVCRE